jgi:potassium-dependent mechanosensitive channel
MKTGRTTELLGCLRQPGGVFRPAAAVAFLTLLPGVALAQQKPAGGEQVNGVMNGFTQVWNYTLFTFEKTSIEVSQVVVAIFILLAGVLVSRFVTILVKKQLLRSGKVDENTGAILERILFYVLLIIVVISSLRVVDIPMTMFTFLGGAAAIGVGFGAQNIFNNFISGLILMTEQPVRLGDLIEVDNSPGRVSHIGARCTRIRRVDGVEILVPNSSLLENNVINRTLSDRVIRTEVSVGVAYGSPVEQVREILQKIAEGHSGVMKKPKPVVLFEDFGDNALVFKIYVWIEMSEMIDLKIVCSEIRFETDRRFREAGITIAFPQRDIHFDSDRLRVELIGNQQKESAGRSPKK